VLVETERLSIDLGAKKVRRDGADVRLTGPVVTPAHTTGGMTNDLVVRQAFIQIAGETATWTAGRAPSFFDFFGSALFAPILADRHSTGPLNLFAVTANIGNGVSASLSLDTLNPPPRMKLP
jgi:hypothetical protein